MPLEFARKSKRVSKGIADTPAAKSATERRLKKPRSDYAPAVTSISTDADSITPPATAIFLAQTGVAIAAAFGLESLRERAPGKRVISLLVVCGIVPWLVVAVLSRTAKVSGLDQLAVFAIASAGLAAILHTRRLLIAAPLALARSAKCSPNGRPTTGASSRPYLLQYGPDSLWEVCGEIPREARWRAPGLCRGCGDQARQARRRNAVDA